MASSSGSGGYYDYFDAKTNGGVVFDENLCSLEDLPLKKLTGVEVEAREKWQKIRRKIRKEYMGRHPPPLVTRTTELLEQRILAPCLVTTSASTQSKAAESRAGRRYPPAIAEWIDFADELANFQPVDKPMNFEVPPFTVSALLGDPVIEYWDERQEEIFIVNFLNQTLYRQRMIGWIVSSGPVIGKPDALVVNMKNAADSDESDSSSESKEQGAAKEAEGHGGAGEKEEADDDTSATSYGVDEGHISTICEFKSTHNLALPMTAASVCDAYNAAYTAVYHGQNGRTKEWSRVCHPIGQLLGYMVDNSKRYGILSSGTRTYFLKIVQHEGGNEVVQISDAMFVGQKGYLKAWVYVDQLHCNKELDSESLPWKQTTTILGTPEKKGSRVQPKRGGGSQSGGSCGGGGGESDGPASKAARLDSSLSSCHGAGGGIKTTSLPSVPFSKVKIIGPLGQGRNGTVFLAEWEDKRVAIKQFDVDKSGFAFEQEVKAYMAVRDGWGRLVPAPFFVSQSWSGGTRFLALQVGRLPRPSDDTSNWRAILAALENEFGLRHEDCDGHKNLLFIPQGDKECLVVVDLEEVTWIRG